MMIGFSLIWLELFVYRQHFGSQDKMDDWRVHKENNLEQIITGLNNNNNRDDNNDDK